MSILRERLLAAVPGSLRLPLRYGYRSISGKLEAELPELVRCVLPHSDIFDVGANIGLYTFALARPSLGQTVHAVEPLALPLRILKPWAKHQKNVRVHEIAVSDYIGEITLNVPYRDNKLAHGSASVHGISAPHEQVRVPVLTLDALHQRYGSGPVSVIKIDVEGSEDAVLRGARGILGRDQPVVLVEIEERHRDRPIEECFRILENLGYAGRFLFCNRWRPLHDFDAAEHQRRLVAKPLDPGYVHNFLFEIE